MQFDELPIVSGAQQRRRDTLKEDIKQRIIAGRNPVASSTVSVDLVREVMLEHAITGRLFVNKNGIWLE